jgi:hypothetical protein
MINILFISTLPMPIRLGSQSAMTYKYYIFISLLLSVTLSGCSTVQLAVSFSPEMQRLREGEREFEQGNYTNAESIFHEISISNGNSQTRNTALYDLACARIITAEDSEDFLSAIHNLDDWQHTPPSFFYAENPNLIVTALKARADVLLEDKIAIEEQRDSAHSQVVENRKIIAGHKRKIAELNSQLQTLQHQIEALEAIDYQIQEKKNPL